MSAVGVGTLREPFHRGTLGHSPTADREFVADVHVRVTGSDGRTVLDVPSQGPIFLLQLPPGAYTVEAEHQGQVKTRRFDVAPGRHDRLGFEW